MTADREDVETSRLAFERRFREKLIMARYPDGRYVSPETEIAWTAWHAVKADRADRARVPDGWNIEKLNGGYMVNPPKGPGCWVSDRSDFNVPLADTTLAKLAEALLSAAPAPEFDPAASLFAAHMLPRTPKDDPCPRCRSINPLPCASEQCGRKATT